MLEHCLNADDTDTGDAGEKADQLKRTAKAHKTNTKVNKAKKDGKVVKSKFKGIRIRKGVRIKVQTLVQ